MPNRPDFDPWRYATAGLELTGALLLLMAIGYGVDQWLDTFPWAMMAGAAVGIVGGLYKLVRDAMKMNRAMQRDQFHGDKKQ